MLLSRRLRFNFIKPETAPTGLIMFLDDGVDALPYGWSYYDTYNTYAILGTTSTTLSTRSSTVLSGNSNSDGGHSNWDQTNYYYHYGSPFGSHTEQPLGNYQRSSASNGAHTHSYTATYEPAKGNARMIQAGANASLVKGIIGLSDSDLSSYHNAYTGWNNDDVLYSASSTGRANSSGSINFSSESFIHNHEQYDPYYPDSGIISGAYTQATSDGPSHTHNSVLNSSTCTDNLRYILLRAYKIFNYANVNGIMGLWTGATIPNGWTLNTNANQRYIKISSTGNGSVVGDGTLSFNILSDTEYHAHNSDNSTTVGYASLLSHRNSVGHEHYTSVTSEAYNLKDVTFKIIQFTG